MKDIETRADINLLVKKFYVKVRLDDLLGPIFNHHIENKKWPAHLEKLTDFWEGNLLGGTSFYGNPAQKHLNVDRESNHTIDASHFEQWLALWNETVDELYQGQLADTAKFFADRIATIHHSLIIDYRPKD